MITIYAKYPDGTIDSLIVDAVVTENYGNAATITKFPREQGTDFSDNIRKEPERLRLDVVITNTPFGGVAGTPPGQLPDLAEQGYRKLLAWQAAGALIGPDSPPGYSLQTTMGPRTNMAIANAPVTRDKMTGGQPGHTGGARISLDLEQIIIVANKLVPVIISRDLRQRPTTKTGNQPAQPVVQDTALLKKINGGISLYNGIVGGN